MTAAALKDVVDAATPYKPEQVIEMESPRIDKLSNCAFWVRDASASTELPYVVKGIFGKGDIVTIWGAPGSGKSFTAMEMACAVSVGQLWHGRRTRRGVVLYVAAESSTPHIKNRFVALKLSNPAFSEANVLVIPIALDLLHSERGDVERVIALAREAVQETGEEVVLTVIDTLAVTFGGGKENSPEDMGHYVSNLQTIRTETGAAILVVHHSGKDEARGMRGHTALLGALDAELAIEGSAGQKHIVRTGKVRDGVGYSDLYAFSLRQIELGVDQDGDPVTTCVVEAMDQAGTRRAREERKGTRLGKNQQAVLSMLKLAGGRMHRSELFRRMKDEAKIARTHVDEVVSGLLKRELIFAREEVIANHKFDSEGLCPQSVLSGVVDTPDRTVASANVSGVRLAYEPDKPDKADAKAFSTTIPTTFLISDLPQPYEWRRQGLEW